jgi:hypothetical protein
MIRLIRLGLTLLIAVLILLLKGSSPLVATAQGQNNAKQQAEESTRDAPPDTTPYRRPALPEDYAPRGIRASFHGKWPSLWSAFRQPRPNIL